MRWSLGADGRVPRLAQRRVSLFFWPMRASSWNQTSSRVRLGSRSRISWTRTGKIPLEGLQGRRVLGVVSGPGGQASVAERLEDPAQSAGSRDTPYSS